VSKLMDVINKKREMPAKQKVQAVSSQKPKAKKPLRKKVKPPIEPRRVGKTRIGIDVQSTKGQRTGLGVYTENLVGALQSLKLDQELLLYSQENSEDLNTTKRLFWENIALPRKAKSDEVDLLHIPAFAPSLRGSFKLVVTVHDMIGRLFPQHLSFGSRVYWDKWMPQSVKRADRIIAISENTKRDIVQHLKIPVEKIEVIPLAPDPLFSVDRNPKLLSETKNKFSISDRFILSVGTIEPRKNLFRIIEAYSELRKKRDVKQQLVVVGFQKFARGKSYEQVRLKVAELGLEQDIIFTGYVTDEDLRALYNAADLFLFPSLYEGFGLPPLEAMACGVPVVTSNNSSIPEVVGDAALKIDPQDINQIVDATDQSLKDYALRQKLIRAGFAQVKKYSWKKTAERTWQVYLDVLNHKTK